MVFMKFLHVLSAVIWVAGMLLTRSPLATRPKSVLPFDLHV